MPFTPGYTPWNKGRFLGQKKPLAPAEVEIIRAALESEGKLRDIAMFDLAIDCKLRGCDLIRLRIRDLFAGPRVRDRAAVVQKKTKRPVMFELSPRTRANLEKWRGYATDSPEDYIFPNLLGSHMSVRQYARIVKKWIALAGLEPSLYATHTMRRTKVAQLYRTTGNLRAVQLLLGHSNIASTVHYLGVDVEDALNLAEQIKM